jgi:hypothetical protein
MTHPKTKPIDKREKKEIREVVAWEWYTKDKNGNVYLHWSYPDKSESSTLTPYKEIPIRKTYTNKQEYIRGMLEVADTFLGETTDTCKESHRKDLQRIIDKLSHDYVSDY